MAAYAKTAILEEVREILEEPNELFWTDVELNVIIDRAARAVSILSCCNVVTQTITTVANQTRYALANEYIQIIACVYLDFLEGMQRITPKMLGHNLTKVPGQATQWMWFGNTASLYIYPVPSAALAADTINVYGCTSVDDYGSGGSETLPDETQYWTVYYTLSSAYTKTGKHSLAGYYMQKFMQECMVRRRDIYDNIYDVDTLDMRKIADYSQQAG